MDDVKLTVLGGEGTGKSGNFFFSFWCRVHKEWEIY